MSLRTRFPANIALVRPPVIQLRNNLSAYGAILPIGLAYVAAVLRDAGHRVQVVDAPGEAEGEPYEEPSPIGPLEVNGLSPEAIVERLEADTTILGITHMFLHEWPTIRRIAERTKQRFPEVVVILGGENATAFHPWIFAQSEAVDYCVLGEGEAVALELVERIQQAHSVAPGTGARANLAGMAGVAARHAATTHMPALARRQAEVDEIPRPAWDLFPVERYLGATDKHGVHRGRSIPMLATRGCPYQCTFCSSPNMWTTKYVTRSPRDVVDEIRAYVEAYQIDNVNFCDLTAIIRREWTVEFAGLLEQEALDITWQLPTGTRTEVLDRDVLQRIYNTGCRNITYAPESGSERMLKVIKKHVKLPRMLESLQAARDTGMVTRVNVIIGHPEEEWRDMLQSLKFLLQAALVGCHDAAVMIFAPYPGSPDFDRMHAAGQLEIADDYYYLALARSGLTSRTYNPRMSTRQLVLAQYGMLLAFYATAYLRRPGRVLRVIQSFFSGRETTLLDQVLRTKLRGEKAQVKPALAK